MKHLSASPVKMLLPSEAQVTSRHDAAQAVWTLPFIPSCTLLVSPS